ncbi:hypothetical protein D3C87_1471960 [compost metagenome]
MVQDGLNILYRAFFSGILLPFLQHQCLVDLFRAGIMFIVIIIVVQIIRDIKERGVCRCLCRLISKKGRIGIVAVEVCTGMNDLL